MTKHIKRQKNQHKQQKYTCECGALFQFNIKTPEKTSEKETTSKLAQTTRARTRTINKNDSIIYY